MAGEHIRVDSAPEAGGKAAGPASRAAAATSLDQALACVRVGPDDFDLTLEVAQLRAGDAGVGAVVSFVGTVREWRQALQPASGLASAARASHEADGPKVAKEPKEPVDKASALSAAEPAASMELEHYPGMTERSIAELIVQAWQRFEVRGVRVIHRVGPLAVSDQIVLVAVSSAHRGQAFQCAEFLMDWLKTQAPFWKKESAGGESRWVDARTSDDEAAARWGHPGLR